LRRTADSCRFRFARLQTKIATEGWDAQAEENLKSAYRKRKASIWSSVAAEMGFEGNWRVLEVKAFDMGIKGLK
jgi:hypothetical protein